MLLVSFGGPEGPCDVLPFLENVVRGKNVPAARLEAVAGHYEPFGGVSPANAEVRALLVALVGEMNAEGPHLPVYWGNRNWHPMLADTVRQMADDGIRRAVAFVTSPFGSYPSCRQYREDIERARQEVGLEAPEIDKLRLFYNHPGFIEAMADRARQALEEIPPERRDTGRILFSAHSIPQSMAKTSPYESQLREASSLVAGRLGRSEWQLVYQSRSGPPTEPWLGPALGDAIRQLAAQQVHDVVIVPMGFMCDNMEIVYDLDIEAAGLCEELGLNLARAGVPGTHPRIVQMIRELIMERLAPGVPRLALGSQGRWPDQCPPDCCLTRPAPPG
ncbi:MAG: ferrochelatase [Thermoguttaceae bacterium]